MEINWRWITLAVWCTIFVSMLVPSTVSADPIKIDFSTCGDASYRLVNGSYDVFNCCPVQTTKPIIDGIPPLSTNFTRVRQAAQCTDAAYAAKLQKGYELMKALPDDDPRSFTQQWHLHCSYCGGAFTTTNSSGDPVGIDIHFSWLFYPWHRYYLYFHERILQSLLEDPTFSLTYWNWDNPYTVGNGSTDGGAYLDDGATDQVSTMVANNASAASGMCLKAGDYFPTAFADRSTSTYDDLRSDMAKGKGRLRFPDFNFNPKLTASAQTNYNDTQQQLIDSNLNIMYQALVAGGTTAETFMGRAYRAGYAQGNPSATGGAGTLEATAHPGVHFWTGHDPDAPTSPADDMGQLSHSARDPVFFAHHSNIDRLWQVWKAISPIVGANHTDWSDPDFLNAEFLFYDENQDLRRVKAGDALDTTNFGYVYQEANDAAWLYLNQTRCSNLDYKDMINQVDSLPLPTKESDGYFHIQCGTPFVAVIDRPHNPHGYEEFLTIDGINLDRTENAGFSVFIDLLNPNSYMSPTRCAEYSGKFTNMAQSAAVAGGDKEFTWKESVTRTLVDINAPLYPSKIVVTLVPVSQYGGTETIKFSSITIEVDTPSQTQ